MAAGLLWVLDACINISMEPFRAFVADLLPEFQRTRGFAMQSLFIGLGAVVASALPYLLTNVFHVGGTASAGGIPFTVRLSFYIGAAAFLGAVLWTVFTTKEYPPDNFAEFQKQKAEQRTAGRRRTGNFDVDRARCRAPCANWPGCRFARGWDCFACGCIFRSLWRGMFLARRIRCRRCTRRAWSGRDLFRDVLAGVLWIFFCPAGIRARRLGARQPTVSA